MTSNKPMSSEMRKASAGTELRALYEKYVTRLTSFSKEYDARPTAWADAHLTQCRDIVADLGAIIARTEAGAVSCTFAHGGDWPCSVCGTPRKDAAPVADVAVAWPPRAMRGVGYITIGPETLPMVSDCQACRADEAGTWNRCLDECQRATAEAGGLGIDPDEAQGLARWLEIHYRSEFPTPELRRIHAALLGFTHPHDASARLSEVERKSVTDLMESQVYEAGDVDDEPPSIDENEDAYWAYHNYHGLRKLLAALPSPPKEKES